ncbi:hypothetical protein [Terriglobus sp.]|uniref:hypothetical protein n=1 Tax=Terriglobus sp. TaxID=1889013 RepID=UPI003B00CDC8
MTRLDRREYKCNHCGAVTVISDNDAERLEQLLKQVMNRQAAQSFPSKQQPNSKMIALGLAGLVFTVTLISLATLSSHHGMSSANSSATDSVNPSVDNYFAHTTVPRDRVVVSPLEWVPDGEGGTYNGLIYNHSGYAVSPPHYNLVLFHNGIKDDQSSSIPLLGTLEPGEYTPVSFRVGKAKPDARYELIQPDRIDRSIFEVAPVALQQPIMVHQPNSPSYYLVGFVQNTLKRQFSGGGLVMLYDSEGRLIGSGFGAIEDLNPGEKTKIVMNAFLLREGKEVASYEYLLDMRYKNERQSVSMQDIEQLGSATVPNRIVRVNHAQVVIAPDTNSFEPADVLRGQ